MTIPREWNHNYEIIGLSDDDLEIVELIAQADAESYEEDKTLATIYDEQKHEEVGDTFDAGRCGEVAVCRALALHPLEDMDIEQSEDGDDGHDIHIMGDTVDVMNHEHYPQLSPGNLMVEYGKVEDGDGDIYVSTQKISGRDIVIHGWLSREELKEIDRVWRWAVPNYVAFADELHPISRLRRRAMEAARE